MPIDRDIQSRVKKVATEKADAITSDELFTSPEFLTHLRNIIETVTSGKYGVKVGTVFSHGPFSINGKTKYTACTEGRTVYQNTKCHLVYDFASLYNQYLAQLGLSLHECAHILYRDFDADKKIIETVKSGALYGKEPTPANQEELDTLSEMKDALAKEEFRPIFSEVYRQLINILADPHDEDKMLNDFGRLVEQGIEMTRTALFNTTRVFEEIVANQSEMNAFYSGVLQLARFDEIHCNDYQTLLRDNVVMQKLISLSSILSEARYTDVPEKKAEYLNHIVFSLWPFIQKELKNQQEKAQQGGGNNQPQCGNSSAPQNNGGQGQQQNGSQDSSQNSAGQSPQQCGDNGMQQAIQNILDQLGQAAAQSGATAAPEKGKTSSVALQNRQAAEAGKQPPQQPSKTARANPENADNSVKSSFEAVISQLSTKQAEKEVQKQVMQSAIQDIKQSELGINHRGVDIKTICRDEYTEQDRQTYEDLMEELSAYSKRLQKQMKEMLRDMQEGSVAHHRSYGNKFEANAAYRPDQRYFAKEKLPQDWPDMAISILVDHSGSMYGSRISSSMKAAMLLFDFATHMDIPVAVSGHNTDGTEVQYYVYTDFRKVSEDEKYRLATMTTDGCNRDGAALEISAHRLAERPEQTKLLIIISDGLPNHGGYRGEVARDDIAEIVRKYRKRGVETIAAAIGSDKDQIKKIYGEGAFLDIDDLSKLPKILVGLVKKRILP